MDGESSREPSPARGAELTRVSPDAPHKYWMHHLHEFSVSLLEGNFHLHISGSCRFSTLCALIFSPLTMTTPAARGAPAPRQTPALARCRADALEQVFHPGGFSSRMMAFHRGHHAAKLALRLSACVALSPRGLSAAALAGYKILFRSHPLLSCTFPT